MQNGDGVSCKIQWECQADSTDGQWDSQVKQLNL